MCGRSISFIRSFEDGSAILGRMGEESAGSTAAGRCVCVAMVCGMVFVYNENTIHERTRKRPRQVDIRFFDRGGVCVCALG